MSEGPHGAAVACTTEQTQLGEGVRWDARHGELLRVDILAKRVYRDRVLDDGALVTASVYDLPQTVGSLAPISGDDGWLLGAGRGFTYLSPDGSHHELATVSGTSTRMNDGACDPQGRFWAGALADDHQVGGGSLYRLDPEGRTEQVLDDLTIPNGIGWSLDGQTMYLVDSGPRVVHAFSFDQQRGVISNGRILISVTEDDGSPDGLTVDADGDLWVAIYGGGKVCRYSPEGVLKESLSLPALQVTSCAFAGPGLNRLYVTTATENWTSQQRKANPSAGLVYRFDSRTVGQPATPYRPRLKWWRS